MDVERMLIDGRYDTSWPFRTCLGIETCKNLPLCECLETIKMQVPERAGEARVFNANHDYVNEYLKEKFEMDIYDFMGVYSSQFFGKAICSPGMLPLFTCVFRKENYSRKLKEQMSYYQSSLSGQGVSLHDDSIFVFTLIECNDVSELKRYGAYHVSQNYRFVLKGSSQGDFTIIYSKK